MNRAVMLRIAACGIIGLGAALLIAALLLSTYTSSRITKIPLNIDATLISDGNGTALDSASLSGDHVVINQNVPLVSQQQISVESPANADVVTLQVGTSVRRTDKQKDNGLLLAIVDTVTLNRKTAMAVSDDTHPGGVGAEAARHQRREPADRDPAAPRRAGLPLPVPHREARPTPTSIRSRRSRSTPTIDGEEDVNGLDHLPVHAERRLQREGKLVAPIKYPSLYAGDEDGKITTSRGDVGCARASRTSRSP